MYQPERDLEERYPTFTLHRCDLGAARAAVIPRERVILLHDELPPLVARATLAHEIAHLDLHHLPTGIAHYATRMELEADRLAAQRLIDIASFAKARAWGLSRADVAHTLQVTHEVLTTWERHLTPSEQRRLRAMFPDGEGVV